MNKIAIGIDIGGTNTAFGIVDQNGNIIFQNSIPTQERENIEDYISDISNELKIGLSSIGDDFELIGIGVGAPNGNYYTGCIEQAANLRWKGRIELSKLLKQHFKVPVIITNDANAAAIGEMIYGGAKNMKDFIVITLGTGLGSGIVINGNLLYGSDGFAGELGHIIVEPRGRKCNCGRMGCLETYVSATGLVRTVYELLASEVKPSKLRDIPFTKLTSKDVAIAAQNGDEIALETFRVTGEKLGQAIADISAITSPEAIFLFGGLANAGKLLIDYVEYYKEEYMLSIFKNKIKLLPSELSEDAALLGASALIWSEQEK
ncbi:MAG: ROK family protein [Salinivirgaceae bacterium]|nr:ROK family protein [Salinivirgaceae bacterium]